MSEHNHHRYHEPLQSLLQQSGEQALSRGRQGSIANQETERSRTSIEDEKRKVENEKKLLRRH